MQRTVMAQASSSTAAEHSASAAYARAVTELNGLQTDAAVLDRARDRHPSPEAADKPLPRKRFDLAKMQGYLERTGLAVGELDRLNVIHVAGTKGKGSVSAMCESILRSHGLKTGFFSSPHLMEVRERIRIDGRPLSKDVFVSAFWESYEQLRASAHLAENRDMPSYFRMLAVMAFHVFLKEEVDAAVIEVGMGGAHDCTNVVAQPVVCAVTSLGYDHINVLGKTIEEIAWHKAGIIKPGRPVFTLPQPPGALSVLRERARERNASSIHVVTDLTTYPGKKPVLALSGKHQLLNGSLAAQVCREWLRQKCRWVPLEALHETVETTSEESLEGIPLAKVFSLPPAFHVGLQDCRWAGRNELFKKDKSTFFLDGAHTPDSVKSSALWFIEAAEEEARGLAGPVCRVLLFNITRSRSPTTMLTPLLGCAFDYALFVPNIANPVSINSPDNTNRTITVEAQCATAAANECAWTSLCAQVGQHTSQSAAPTGASVEQRSRTFGSICEALDWLSLARSPASPPDSPPLHTLAAANHVQVLVTGSMHLVGDVMGVLGRTADDV